MTIQLWNYISNAITQNDQSSNAITSTAKHNTPPQCHLTIHSKQSLGCDTNKAKLQAEVYALDWIREISYIIRHHQGQQKIRAKMAKKQRHTFMKIAKIMAVYIAANMLKLLFSNPRKIYILGKIHTTMTSRSHIPTVSNKAHGLW